MENDPGRELVRGHTYSNIISRDQAQVHIGDRHNYGDHSNHSHNYYFCASSSQQSSQVFTLSRQAIPCGASEPQSLKRRRSLDENEYPHKSNKEESLEHVLSRLAKFSESIQGQRKGGNAKKIARRIALALNAVKQQAGLMGLAERSSTHITHDEDDFESINNCLIVAKRVDINTGFRRTKHTKLTRVIRKYDRLMFEQWKICLRTSIFESRNEDGTEVVESIFAMDLDPRFNDSNSPFTVRLSETTMHASVNFISPIILAYRVVPRAAEVFKAVETDDLEGLVALLADGKATLRDCYGMGETLLHHACDHGSPRCCQYLIDKGADVERMAMQTYGQKTIHHFIPLDLCLRDAENDHAFERRLCCWKILLKSGADPTFNYDNAHSPVFYAMEYAPAFFEPILVESISFIDPKNYRETGESLWLQACRHAHRSAPSTLKILRDSGCDIAETDDIGWNGLFHIVLGPYPGPEISFELEKLEYLLGIFDDIHAKDAKGYTIFDLVEDSLEDGYGSYRRDLWYCALERAGIDVSSHLVQHPRVPSYTVPGWQQYTPEHYHALKHLQSWNRENFRAQMDRLLEEIPLEKDEALEMERLQRKKLKMDLYGGWNTDDQGGQQPIQYNPSAWIGSFELIRALNWVD